MQISVWMKLFFLSLCCLCSVIRSEEILTLDGRPYRFLKDARHDSCNVTFDLRAGNTPVTSIDLAFSIRSAECFTRLVCTKDGFTLEQFNAGKCVRIANGKMPYWDRISEGASLILKFRTHWFEVIAGESRLCRILGENIGNGGVGILSAPGQPDVTDVHYQRIEPTVFGDDFMRTEEEAQDLGLWKPNSGNWRIYSVMEQIQANPDARIREGREPAADHSPNPFCLSGSGNDEACIFTGMPFWDDYALDVSVKTLGATFGLVFGVTSPETFWYVRWGLYSPGIRTSLMELVRRRNGVDEVVASARAAGRAGNWYRLGIRSVGSRIDVILDRQRLIRVWSDESVGGRIGLYAKGDNETLFDDVFLRSIGSLSFDDARLLETVGETIEGNWELRGDTGRLMFAATNRRHFGRPDECIYALGLVDWPAQCFQVQVIPEDPDAAAFGALFAMTSPDDYWRVIWTDDSLVLANIRAGQETPVATSSCRLEGHDLTDLQVDLRQPDLILVRVNDLLHFRVHTQQPLGGRIGLYSRSRKEVVFRHLEAFADPVRDWEQPVNVEIFADDPFMQGWASPRYAWIRQPGEAGDSFPQTFLHKGDFYGAFKLDLPIDNDMHILFGNDDITRKERYELAVTVAEGQPPSATLVLTRDAEKVAETQTEVLPAESIPGQQIIDEKIGALPRTPDTHTYGRLTLERDGKYVWLSFAGKEILQYADDAPLAGRSLALQLPQKLDFIHVSVIRDHLRDELFEKAAVDWTNIGTWEVTNRFACDPRWSHMNGRSKGVAALWNKFDYPGDYTVEYYAGMRMRQGDMMEGAARMYYPRVGDINLALNADGHDLFSGTNVIFAAWDPMWTERWTEFWYKGNIIDKADREFIPRGRDTRPKTRPIEVDWDPGGRPVHGAWYFIKVRRTGQRFDVQFDNVPVFSTECPGRLDGNRIALWTQHNSIVIARVKIGYENCCTIPFRDLPDEEPPQISPAADEPHAESRSHPAFSADFESSLDGFLPFAGDQSAGLSLERHETGGQALRLENLHAGGDFGVLLPTGNVDLGRVTSLSMDGCFSKQARVNLYITFLDAPHEHAFFVLTGPAAEGPNMACLGKAKGIRPNGRWCHLDLNLAEAVRKAFPWRGNYFASEVVIGMLHEGYLNAGHEGNPEGALYWIDNVEMESVGPDQLDITLSTDSAAEQAFQTCLLPRGETPSFSDDQPPITDGRCSLTVPGTGRFRFWYRQRTVEKGWNRPRSLPIHSARPIEFSLVVPDDHTHWGGGPLQFQLSSWTGSYPDLSTLSVSLNRHPLRVNVTNVTYDPENGMLSLAPDFSPELSLADSETAVLRLTWRDSLRSPPLPPIAHVSSQRENAAAAGESPQPESPAEAETDTRVECLQEFSMTMDYRADHTPPEAPVADTELFPRLTFDRGTDGVIPFSIASTVRISSVPHEPEAGNRALAVENILCGSEFSVALPIDRIILGRFPILSLDYRTDIFSHSDFLLQIPNAKYTIGFTDDDPQNTDEIARFPEIIRDGKWHTTEVNLGDQLQTNAAAGWGNTPCISRFAVGDWGYSGDAPGARNEFDNIAFVPVISSAQGTRITWASTDASGIRDFSFCWNAALDAEPDETPDCTSPEIICKDLPEGENGFHVRARDRAGNWSRTSHNRFLIDNTPPQVITVSPTDASLAAADAICVTFDKGIADVDISAVDLTLNGKKCRLNASSAKWEPGKKQLTWDMLSDWGLLRREVPDGTDMKAELSGIRDFAGNQGTPCCWTWKVDYAKDSLPPAPPTLWSQTQSFLNYDHFTGTPGHWRAYNAPNGPATELTVIRDPETRNECLQLRKSGTGRRFGASRYRGKLALDQFPLISFDYRIMPGTRVNLLLFVNKTWYAVHMTGSDALPIVGELPDARDDGAWRSALIDVNQMLRTALPEEKSPTVQVTAFGEWTAENPLGATICIDNFAYLGPSCPLPLFSCSAADATGITEFELAFDMNPTTLPTIRIPSSGIPSVLTAADTPGMWYIHARARDGAGNWGETLHFPYYCTDVVPAQAENGFEAGNHWQFDRKYSSQGRIYRARSGETNDLLGVQLLGNSEPALFRMYRHVDLSVSPKAVIRADIYVSGRDSLNLYAAMRNAKSNEWTDSSEVELTPNVWHKGVEFTFPQEEDSGRITPAASVRNLAFTFNGERKKREVILIDRITVDDRRPL